MSIDTIRSHEKLKTKYFYPRLPEFNLKILFDFSPKYNKSERYDAAS